MGDTWFEFSIGDALRISRQGLSDTPSLVRVHEDKTACPRQWSTRLSKLTHHPLELPMTAVPHGCVQFVRIDGTSAPAGSVTDTVESTAFDGQLTVTVLADDAPLYASSCVRMYGFVNTIVALVAPLAAKLTLLVVNPPHGPDTHQSPEPQSATCAGY